MHLSRLLLERRHLAVARDLGDVGELHRTLMRGFPQVDGDSPRQQLGVLFRVELPPGRPATVILQSRVLPDWSALPAGYAREWESKDTAHVLDALDDGRELRFCLVANPSRKSAAHRADEAPPRNSRRVALTTDEERHAWLVGRGQRDGFAMAGEGTFDGVRIDPVLGPPYVSGGRRRTGVVVRPVRYEGRLRVEDASRFREAIVEGIGPAKAYGCGLMSLAAR